MRLPSGDLRRAERSIGPMNGISRSSEPFATLGSSDRQPAGERREREPFARGIPSAGRLDELKAFEMRIAGRRDKLARNRAGGGVGDVDVDRILIALGQEHQRPAVGAERRPHVEAAAVGERDDRLGRLLDGRILDVSFLVGFVVVGLRFDMRRSRMNACHPSVNEHALAVTAASRLDAPPSPRDHRLDTTSSPKVCEVGPQ